MLLTLADFAEEHDQPMPSNQLLGVSELGYAEFFRRLHFLVDLGLVRVERVRPLAGRGQRLALTGRGTLRVVAERAATRTPPAPGPRSRISPLALETPDAAGPSSG